MTNQYTLSALTVCSQKSSFRAESGSRCSLQKPDFLLISANREKIKMLHFPLSP